MLTHEQGGKIEFIETLPKDRVTLPNQYLASTGAYSRKELR
jgi:hypothetical protein